MIDDAEMKISHVIRGVDHISNTPKQILLIEALNLRMPLYAHLPLILAPDRTKFSKRHGAASVGEYRELGYAPEALINFLALLGWSPTDNQEIFSREELIDKFSLERVQKSPAIFDVTKLEWMNSSYIKKMSPEELYSSARLFLPKTKKTKSYILKVLALERPRLRKLSELADATNYFFNEPEYEPELLRWKGMTNDELLKSLEQSLVLLEKNGKLARGDLEKTFLKAAGQWPDRGKLLWPLRVTLSGKKASPGPFEIMEIIGISETRKRLRLALNKINN